MKTRSLFVIFVSATSLTAMYKTIPIISLLILFFSTASARENYIYTRISQKEGLTSTINSIYKEKDGDVWLGTPNGLYSFNGHTLRNHQDSILAGRRVFQTGIDRNGDFWILTNRGLLRKIGSDIEVVTPSGENDDNHPFQCMFQDDDGIWFGSNRRIYRYIFSDSSLTLFKDLNEQPSFVINSIILLDEHTLLCGSHNGLLSIDTKTGETGRSPFSLFNEVTSLLIDSKDRIWISFYNHGIAVFEKNGRLIRRYSTSDSALSNDVVLCMTERESSVWAGTDGGGVNIIDPETGNIRVLSHIAGDPSSFPAHSIKSIYTDDYDNIWAGSIREGLIRISQSGMKTYSDSHIGLDSGLSNPTVLCLYQDSTDDDIWIGTDGEGLNRFDPVKGTFTHYPSTLKTKVVSIASYSETELALSIYADRILLFDKNTGKTRPLEIDDDNINYLLRYAGRSLNLANGPDGSLLLISNTVSRFDRKTGKCTEIGFNIGDKANGNLLTIRSGEEGLWMHDYFNIYLLPAGGSQIIRKGHTNKHRINSGHLDGSGRIWLATDKGLCRFNISDGTFSHVHTTLLQTATSVVCDGSSRVWVGTDNGLYAYLENFDSFTLFGESDGASRNEYLSKPRLVSREGDIYLGGVQGLLRVDSGYSIDMTDEPTVNLYGLTVDNEVIHPDGKGLYRIPRNSKRIEIGVALQEKDIFREKVYRFMIPDVGSVYEGKSPVLVLQQMNKPGKHDIMVTYTRRNGEWCEPVRLLTLKIPQPWYLSGWFIAGILLLTALGAVTAHMSMTRRRDNKIQLALKEQEQKVYEEKVRMLINISHELRTPLTLIMAPLKRLIKGKATDKEEQTATLSRIYRQSKRMRDLLDMVLDLRKLEVGKSGLRMESTEFNEWITSTVEDIIKEESAEGIHIFTELDPAVGIADIDRRKCETVLMNILMNAIKHSSEGDSIMIRTSLTGSGNVRVSIADEGPGLEETDKEKLFSRFYQNNNEKYGSGIGLSYSKILVELQGGAIGAENNAGKGATFWWEIPVESKIITEVPARAYLNEIIDDSTAENIRIPETETFSTSRLKLMLVDDSQDLLDFLREALTGNFAEIITASSGNSAMSIIAGGKLPDIIVSDVNMSDGDGYKLCAELKANETYSHIPVVLLTARGEEQSQSDSYKVGADAFMAKPFEVDTLMELLRGMLRKRNEIRRKYLDSDEKTTSEYGSNEESFILKLNRIISEHIDNPDMDQQLLCREMGMSRASLFNKMKSITGSGAKEYITRIRLEKAKKLIEETDMTIAEISDSTGFASQSYFSTAFKNYTGLTPSQYKLKK